MKFVGRIRVDPNRSVPFWTQAVGQGGCRLERLRGTETHARSVLKAVSWRTLGTVDTFVISWFMTGKLSLASSIAGLEFVTKIAWYYLHERIWAAVRWGSRPH